MCGTLLSLSLVIAALVVGVSIAPPGWYPTLEYWTAAHWSEYPSPHLMTSSSSSSPSHHGGGSSGSGSGSGGWVRFTRDPVTGTLWFECDPESYRASVEEEGEGDLGCQVWSVGYSHAMDRPVSLFTLRIIAQGRLSELLLSNNDTLLIDSFMRDLSLAHDAAFSAATLSLSARRLLQSYADGINHYMSVYPRPFEFLLVGLTPEPWTVADSVLIMKLMNYVPLAEVQRDAEAFIFTSLKVTNPPPPRQEPLFVNPSSSSSSSSSSSPRPACLPPMLHPTAPLCPLKTGVNPDVLKSIFSPHLDGITPELLDLYSKVKFAPVTIPREVQFLAEIPRTRASNNWVLSPKRSATGHGISPLSPLYSPSPPPLSSFHFHQLLGQAILTSIPPDCPRSGLN